MIVSVTLAFLQTVGDLQRDIVDQVGDGEERVVELHDPGIDRGKVEDVVDQRQQNRGGIGDVVEIFRLPLGERVHARRAQQNRQTR